jgi:hypothetical protein
MIEQRKLGEWHVWSTGRSRGPKKVGKAMTWREYFIYRTWLGWQYIAWKTGRLLLRPEWVGRTKAMLKEGTEHDRAE